MANLTKAAFKSKYAGIFADNSTRQISEADMRDFKDDIADSFLNDSDVTAVSWGGSWSFPGDEFPNPIKEGTLYVATGNHGELGDPDYVQEGTWFVSIIPNATEYSDFSFKP